MMVIHGMMQNNLVIGLTGGSGCGKSIFAKAAVDLGFTHIDADVIGHNIIRKGNLAYDKVIDTFGRSILDENGEIIRRKLGEIVFSDTGKLETLNKILHPLITDKILSMIDGPTVIDGAVLHKTPDIIKLCKHIVAIVNSTERRIKFICDRDKIDESSALKRISSQPDNDFYSNIADFVITSDSDAESLYNKSIEVIKRCKGA